MRKTIAIFVLAVLFASTFVTAITEKELWSQRLVSNIRYSPARLKTFCSMSPIVAESYNNKVCRNKNGNCILFLADVWKNTCKRNINEGVQTYNYQEVFASWKDYMRESRLSLLTKNKHEITPSVEETTTTIPEETTTTIPEETTTTIPEETTTTTEPTTTTVFSTFQHKRRLARR